MAAARSRDLSSGTRETADTTKPAAAATTTAAAATARQQRECRNRTHGETGAAGRRLTTPHARFTPPPPLPPPPHRLRENLAHLLPSGNRGEEEHPLPSMAATTAAATGPFRMNRPAGRNKRVAMEAGTGGEKRGGGGEGDEGGGTIRCTRVNLSHERLVTMCSSSKAREREGCSRCV